MKNFQQNENLDEIILLSNRGNINLFFFLVCNYWQYLTNGRKKSHFWRKYKLEMKWNIWMVNRSSLEEIPRTCQGAIRGEWKSQTTNNWLEKKEKKRESNAMEKTEKMELLGTRMRLCIIDFKMWQPKVYRYIYI